MLSTTSASATAALGATIIGPARWNPVEHSSRQRCSSCTTSYTLNCLPKVEETTLIGMSCSFIDARTALIDDRLQVKKLHPRPSVGLRRMVRGVMSTEVSSLQRADQAYRCSPSRIGWSISPYSRRLERDRTSTLTPSAYTVRRTDGQLTVIRPKVTEGSFAPPRTE